MCTTLTSIREQPGKEGENLPEVVQTDVARDDAVHEVSLSPGLQTRQPAGQLELLLLPESGPDGGAADADPEGEKAGSLRDVVDQAVSVDLVDVVLLQELLHQLHPGAQDVGRQDGGGHSEVEISRDQGEVGVLVPQEETLQGRPLLPTLLSTLTGRKEVGDVEARQEVRGEGDGEVGLAVSHQQEGGPQVDGEEEGETDHQDP